jgi:MFS family permease
MNRREAKWWLWLAAGSACCIVAVLMGPLADRHGYATPAGFALSLTAVVAWIVCWVVGFVRLFKLLSSKLRRDQGRVSQP